MHYLTFLNVFEVIYDIIYHRLLQYIVLHVVEQFQQCRLTLPLDVLAYASRQLPVRHLPPVFMEGIVRQLRTMAHCLATYSEVLSSFDLLDYWFSRLLIESLCYMMFALQ